MERLVLWSRQPVSPSESLSDQGFLMASAMSAARAMQLESEWDELSSSTVEWRHTTPQCSQSKTLLPQLRAETGQRVTRIGQCLEQAEQDKVDRSLNRPWASVWRPEISITAVYRGPGRPKSSCKHGVFSFVPFTRSPFLFTHFCITHWSSV